MAKSSPTPTSRMGQTTWVVAQLGILCALLLTSLPAAAFDLSYGGRLTHADGRPIDGPTDITLRFYDVPTAGSPKLAQDFPSVMVTDGIFQVEVSLNGADAETLLGDGSAPLYVEVVSQGVVYPRQRFVYAPLALRVPIDEATLTYNASGKLSVKPQALGAVQSVAGRTGAITLSTTDITEHSSRQFFTDARARSALFARSPVNLDHSSGEISLSYMPLNKAGDIMSGTLNMNGQSITGLAAPSNAADAVTKGYADQKIGGLALSLTGSAEGKVLKYSAGSFVMGDVTLGSGVSGTVAIANGGTGATSASDAFDALSPLTTIGDLLYAGPSGTDARLPGNTSTTRQFLVSQGSGSAANVPAWGTLGASDIPALDADKISSGTLANNRINWAAPGTIGATTPNTAAFTSVTASSITTSGQVGVNITPFDADTGGTSDLRFGELAANGSDYVGLKAPDNIASSIVWTLPSADGAPGDVLTTDGQKRLSWTPAGSGSGGSGGPPTGAAGGDLSSIYPNPVVATVGGLAANSVASGAIAANAATSLNTASKIVRRDANGDFAAGTITANTFVGALTGNATNVTGTVAISNGGTGATVFTNNGVLIGHGSSPLSATAAGTQYQVLRADASGVPAFGAINLDQSAAVTGALGLANGGTGATTAASARTNLGLGTASTLDVGTAASNLVQLDANAKLPAVDGTQLAGLVKTAGDTMTGTLNLPSNGITIGTNQLVASGGNVGIGTISPSENLEVRGSVGSPATSGTAQNGVFRLGGSDGGALDFGTIAGAFGSWLQSTDRTNLAFRYPLLLNPAGGAVTIGTTTLGSGALNVMGGNVGIGTTTPRARVEVRFTDSSSVIGANLAQVGLLLRNSDSTINNWNLIEFDSANGGVAASIGAQVADHTNHYGDFVIATRGTGGWGEKMRVGSNGNVGIGTTAPGGQLHLYGSGQTTAAMTTASGLGGSLLLQDSGNGVGNGGALMFGVRQGHFAAIKALATNGANNTTGEIAFSTRNATTDATLTERMRISVLGNVGIGSTDPGAKLDVTGNIRSSGALTSTGYDTGGANARIVQGDYGVIHRNDSVNYYLLLTSAGAQYGGWNTLRPFTLSLATGDTTINSVKFSAGGSMRGKTNAAGAVNTVDWSQGNVQTISPSVAAITFTNMEDGGTYTLVCTDTTAFTHTFSQAGLTFSFSPINGPVVLGSRTVYNFVRAGTSVFVTWSTGM